MAPVFLVSAGARFTTTRLDGNSMPQFFMAERTRSLDSLTGGHRQADDFKTGESPAHIRLHGDGVAGDAGESEAADTGKHDGIPSF